MNHRLIVSSALASVLALGLVRPGAARRQDDRARKSATASPRPARTTAPTCRARTRAPARPRPTTTPDDWKYVAKGTCKDMKGLTEAEAKAQEVRRSGRDREAGPRTGEPIRGARRHARGHRSSRRHRLAPAALRRRCSSGGRRSPFVEVHSENFFADGGAALALLTQARAALRRQPARRRPGARLGRRPRPLAPRPAGAPGASASSRCACRDHASLRARAARARGARAGARQRPAADRLHAAALDIMAANVQRVQERLARPIAGREPVGLPRLGRRRDRRARVLQRARAAHRLRAAARRQQPRRQRAQRGRADPVGRGLRLRRRDRRRRGRRDPPRRLRRAAARLVIDDHGSRVHAPVWQVYAMRSRGSAPCRRWSSGTPTCRRSRCCWTKRATTPSPARSGSPVRGGARCGRPPSDDATAEREALRQQLLLRALWRDARVAARCAAGCATPCAPARGLAAYRGNAGALAERALARRFPTRRSSWSATRLRGAGARLLARASAAARRPRRVGRQRCRPSSPAARSSPTSRTSPTARGSTGPCTAPSAPPTRRSSPRPRAAAPARPGAAAPAAAAGHRAGVVGAGRSPPIWQAHRSDAADALRAACAPRSRPARAEHALVWRDAAGASRVQRARRAEAAFTQRAAATAHRWPPRCRRPATASTSSPGCSTRCASAASPAVGAHRRRHPHEPRRCLDLYWRSAPSPRSRRCSRWPSWPRACTSARSSSAPA